jgi:hypothetical protein
MEHIRKGSEITTLAGYLVVTGYNGSIVYCDEYTNTDEDDPDKYEKTDERMLTLREIEHEMWEVDGRSHWLVYDEED